ncbi:MAG: hypothetical protein COT88_01905 [Candidatus Colwellbacteria bacterium CG10_big_fil_rev_8_21_14_0_10_41_28]|uniref:30S ribosomal protein S21 n=1 Tax=Candidatus Colwellbacteria bacterium CG10_big_fil_rev_8_21_14_0_10_41_28 TaxID=1974539 RepID=A0A2H0VH19_9BACT|nr:MAG: hypothetical protein COT88_01905 [Candidatus Colwellbacteria bacterium CG10_big_fil_rev_8_21_14_0_10_41_28]
MANINLKKKEGESSNSLLYRFSKKLVQSGIIKESKRRRYKERNVNKNKRRESALNRENKAKEVEKARKMGNFRF